MFNFSVVKYICFTLFGCTNDKSKPISQNALIDYSNDMQITYLCSGGGSSIPATKSDTGYYYIGDDRIIIYIDSKTQKATPLCAKPDCMHNDPDTCDAYVNSSENISQDSLWGSLGTAIQYYQGYLYMVCGEYDKSMIEYNTYLMKMDKDGTNRQKVTDYFDSPFTNWFIHQGYFITPRTLLFSEYRSRTQNQAQKRYTKLSILSRITKIHILHSVHIRIIFIFRLTSSTKKETVLADRLFA